MTRTFLLSLAIILSITVHAQGDINNYVPGYIITNANDTVNGYINYSTEKSAALKCVFKEH